MSILSSVSNFFLPSESVARKRRLDIFGTENKAVVGTTIVGGAIALGAAPYLVSSVGGVSAVAKGIGNAFSGLSTGTKLAVAGTALVATPPLIAGVVTHPTVLTKAPASYVNFEKNLATFVGNPSQNSALNIIKEDPVLSGVVGGATALGIAGAIGLPAASLANLGATVANTNAVKKNTISSSLQNTNPKQGGESLPSISSASPPANPQKVPITRETQVMGKEPSGRSATKHKKSVANNQPSVKVQVFNQNNYIPRGY